MQGWANYGPCPLKQTSHLSISFRVPAGWGYSTCLAWGAGYTLDKSPINHRANKTNKHSQLGQFAVVHVCGLKTHVHPHREKTQTLSTVSLCPGSKSGDTNSLCCDTLTDDGRHVGHPGDYFQYWGTVNYAALDPSAAMWEPVIRQQLLYIYFLFFGFLLQTNLRELFLVSLFKSSFSSCLLPHGTTGKSVFSDMI